jgi:hypothetical protein
LPKPPVGPSSIAIGAGIMATSSSPPAAASSEPLEVPPLPPKLRPKPQRKGNIGEGKLYADEAAFLADVELWEQEQTLRHEQVKERERAQEQLRECGREKRDRSSRQRQSNDSARRVQQRREANPNVLPKAVVDMFGHLLSADLWRWCDNDRVTPAIIAAGLPPPQCLIDFLDGGGSAGAHPADDTECPGFSRDTLLQLAADDAGPRVVELLLQHGASVDGAMTRTSALYRAVEQWTPIAKACQLMACPHFHVEGGKCFCIAHATAREKVIRLLLNAGARDARAAEHIAALSLEVALDHWEVQQNSTAGRRRMDALKRGWSDAKLREMQALFLSLHS